MNEFSCGNDIATILATINYGVNLFANYTGANVSVNFAANYIGPRPRQCSICAGRSEMRPGCDSC